jgi:hypothetical protein
MTQLTSRINQSYLLLVFEGDLKCYIGREATVPIDIIYIIYSPITLNLWFSTGVVKHCSKHYFFITFSKISF